jgi:16S rRNA C967 or C1407 C5-methylase (RsmB/RsmF family)
VHGGLRRRAGGRALHFHRQLSGVTPTSPGCGRKRDYAALAALQKRLLQKAVALLKPGGALIYCTCSLEPEEGEQAIASLLASRTRHAPRAGRAGEVAGLAEIVTADGDLRTLPCHLPMPTPGWRAGWILRRAAG